MKTITDSNLELCLNDLFTAGIETTTTTLQWLLVCVLRQPQIQEKIHEEIINEIGYGRYPELSDCQKLSYLNACLHKVLPVSVIVPLGIPRNTKENTNLNGTYFPKETHILVNFWNIQRNEKYWENPTSSVFIDGSMRIVKSLIQAVKSATYYSCRNKRMPWNNFG